MKTIFSEIIIQRDIGLHINCLLMDSEIKIHLVPRY